MEVEEIKNFFKEIEEIPVEKKTELARFLLGTALLSTDSDKVADIIFSDREFEESFKDLVRFVSSDEKLVEKSGIISRLTEEKDLICKLRKYYELKKTLADISEPLGVYGAFLHEENKKGTVNFFVFMSLFTLNGKSPLSTGFGSS